MSSQRFKQFATPHCHPASLDSASTPAQFAKREVELGSPTITTTDHGTLNAAHQVYELGKKSNLIPIIGIESYFRDDNCPILTKMGIPKTDTIPHGNNRDEWRARHPEGTFIDYCKYFHLTLHAMDYDGYLTIVELLSKADANAEKHGTERKPMFVWSDVEEIASKNVTATSSCLIGMTQRHLMNQGNLDGANAYFERLNHLFRDRFYVEVFPHECTHNYVKAIFIDVEGQNGTETIRYKWEKKLKTDGGELDAESLANTFKSGKHKTLLGQMNYRKWEDLEPKRIIAVRKEEGFLQNECKPWSPNGDVQHGTNRLVLDLAEKHKIPVLISDDSHFAYENDKVIQDIRLSQGNVWKFHNSYHRFSSDEAYLHLNHSQGTSEKEFEGWIQNSYDWSERFRNFKFQCEPSLPTKFYPEDTLKHTKELILKHGRFQNKPEQVARLKQEIDLFHRNGTLDLLSYFQIDEEVCSFFESKGIITGFGRGSAGGVYLAYLLGITRNNPLDYGLSLDRFLTKDRILSGKLPDIDQDLSKRQKDLLLDPDNGWLFKRFGDHVAQISTDTTLRLKNAAYDVARARDGYVDSNKERLITKFETPPQGVDDLKFVKGYSLDGIWQPGSSETDPNLKKYIQLYPEDYELMLRCLGLARGRGRHASAYCIANKPIKKFIPLTTVSGIQVTDFTMNAVEAVGGIKMDFLGLGCLDDIGDAIQLIQARHANVENLKKYKLIEHEEDSVGWGGEKVSDKRFSIIVDGVRVPSQYLVPAGDQYFDVAALPPDQAVFDDVASGNTESVFQFSTEGAVKWLKYFDFRRSDGNKMISSIEDMAIFTALDRKGPLDMFVMNPDWDGDPKSPNARHNMLVEYSRRARGLTGSPEIPQIMEELVPETYGILVYQESLERVYKMISGCSGPEAEAFRRKIAKKKADEVAAEKDKWMATVTPKMGKENAETIWDSMESWSGYGFGLSHATSYGTTAYACAYLKHHYPLEWWTSILNNATKDEINEKFWKQCGHLVLLPDIQFSKDKWVIEGKGIRAPLSLIQGIGPKAHEQIMQYAPYSSVEDFVEKIRLYREAGRHMASRKKKGTDEYIQVSTLGRSAVHRGIVHTLIISGSMDSMFPEGSQIDDCMAHFDKCMRDTFGKAYKPPKKDYPRLDPIGRYQLRKSVITAYGEDLRPIVNYAGLPDFITVANKSMRFKFTSWNSYKGIWMQNDESVVSRKSFEAWNKAIELPEGGIRLSLLAYVESKRLFIYQGFKQAANLMLDVGASKHDLVYWPDDQGELPQEVMDVEPGAIVAVSLKRTKVEKGFSITALKIIRHPLQLNKGDEEDE